MSTTLYERLGGRTSIEAIVDEFYARVRSDERVNDVFEDTDMAALRAHQTQFISALAGGPAEYDGEDLSEAHAHLDVDGRDFRIVVDHLDDALVEFDVSERERTELVGAVADLESAIVVE